MSPNGTLVSCVWVGGTTTAVGGMAGIGVAVTPPANGRLVGMGVRVGGWSDAVADDDWLSRTAVGGSAADTAATSAVGMAVT